jgi:hypothetical protein
MDAQQTKIQTIINNVNASDCLKQSKKKEKVVFGNLQNSTDKCVALSTISMLKKEAERLDR